MQRRVQAAIRVLFLIFLSVLSSLSSSRPAAAGYWWFKITNSQPATIAQGSSPALGIAMARESYYELFANPPPPGCTLTYSSTTGGLLGAVCKGKSSSATCRESTPGPWGCSHAALLECETGEVRTATGCSKLTGEEVAPEPATCNGSGGNPSAGNPVSVLDGEKIEHVVDYQTAGPVPLIFERTYRSNVTITASASGGSTTPEAARSMFGRGWRSSFDTALTLVYSASFASPSNKARVNLVTPEGEETAFIYSSSSGKWVNAYYDDTAGSWKSGRSNLDVVLSVVNSGGVQEAQVLFPDDRTYAFDFHGRLKQIRSRSGYTLTPSFNASSQPISVTDSFGRTLTFAYNSSGLLDTLTTPGGQTYRYSYLERLDTQDWMSSGASTHGEYVLQKVAFPDDTPDMASDDPSITYHYETSEFPYALTGITDERGVRYATFSYDSSGRATQTTHAAGADDTQIAYGSGETTVTNPLTRQSVYTYATVQGNRRVSELDGLATTHCAASNTSYAYDPNGYVSKKTDAEGHITTLTNTSRGLPITVTEAFGTPEARTTTVSWDATWHVPTRILETDRTIDLTYDSSGRLITRAETDTSAGGSGSVRSWSYTYSSSGLVLSLDGPLAGSGDTVSYTYTPSGYLSSITDELGHITSITAVTGSGYPATLVDGNGIGWALAYDARNRLTSVTVDTGGPLEAATTFTYDAIGNIVRLTRPDGSWLDYAWDDARRLTLITGPLADQAAFTYDAQGNVAAVTTSEQAGATLRRSLTSAYDELGRLLTTIGAAGQTTAFAYDRNDQLTSRTDARGNTYGYAYDGLDRVIGTTDEEGAWTSLSRDAHDAVISHTDPKGVTTSFTRNGHGEAVTEASPDIGATTLSRDARGLLSEMTDARGVVREYSYDNAGRLTAETYPAAPADSIAFIYDTVDAANFGVGHMTGMTDASGSTAMTWTRRGELASSTAVIGSLTYAVAYTYDAAGRVTSLTYPSGREVSFSRNGAGEVAEVETRASATAAWVEVVSDVDFLPFGPFHSASLGNGQTLIHEWTQDYAIASISLSDGTGDLRSRSYTFGDEVNITAIADPQTTGSETFAYTPANRLETASGPWGDLTFATDANGNRTRLSSGGSVLTYSLDPLSNRMTGVSVGSDLNRSLAYDAAGNLITDTRGAHVYAYGYDSTGKLSFLTKNGVAWATYLANGSGQRASRTLTEASGSPGSTHYVYDAEGHLLAEADGETGETVREYLWLGDLPIAVVDTVNTSPAIYWVITDHLTRPVELRDEAGAQVWSAVFDPYGELVSVSGSLSLDSRFPGQWFELEAGLFNNWHRHYDPSLGRYTTPDPIGLNGGTNRYAYAAANPVMNIDPDGQQIAAPMPTPGIPLPLPPVFIPGTPENKRFVDNTIEAFQKLCRWSREFGGGGGGDNENDKPNCNQTKKEICIPECSDLVLSASAMFRQDQSHRFSKCVRQCLHDLGCSEEGTDYPGGWDDGKFGNVKPWLN